MSTKKKNTKSKKVSTSKLQKRGGQALKDEYKVKSSSDIDIKNLNRETLTERTCACAG